MVYVLKLKLIDWCLMPTLAVFQLYRGIKQKLSLYWGKYETKYCLYNAEMISF
jgi:hypothetical protein